MKWVSLRGFAVRLLICLVLAGGLYGLVLARQAASTPKPTPVEKLAALRASLDENYLRATSLSRFTPRDATAASTLQRLGQELNNDTLSLIKAQQAAGGQLTTSQQQAIDSFIEDQQQAYKRFKQAYAVFDKVIAYEPSDDLNMALEARFIAGRATAASKGLTSAANNTNTTASSGGLGVENQNGASLLVSDTSKQVLTEAAGCFSKVSELAGTGSSAAAQAQRDSCINNYPDVRRQAVANLLENSFNAEYRKNLDQSIKPLLKQLDAKIKADKR